METVLTRGALFAFTSDAQYLALCETDARLRIFETGSGKCLLQLKSRADADGSKWLRKELKTALSWRPSAQAGWYVLLGSGYGIEAVDLALGEVKWRFQYDSGISAVTSDLDEKRTLFCSLNDRSGGELNVEDGTVMQKFKIGKHKARHLLCVDGLRQLVLGGSHLMLWNAEKNKSVMKYAGHPTSVTALAVSPGGDFVLSAAEGECHVALWKTDGNEKNVAGLLTMEHPVVCLGTASLREAEDGQKRFAALAVSEAGVAFIWQCRMEAHEKLSSSLWATIRVKQQEAAGSILSAKLLNRSDTVAVHLVYGNVAFPAFEICLLDALTSDPALIEIDPVETSLLKGDSGGDSDLKKKRKREAEVVGGDNNGAMMEVAAVLKSRGAPEETVPASEHMTLGERLQQLESRIHKAIPPPTDKKSGPLTASSAAVLIRQITQSGDMELYGRAMRLPNDTVAATVKQLTSEEASKFLTLCVERLRVRPKEVYPVVGWIRALLKFHAAYLMSAPGIQQSITSVHQLLETRLAGFDRLVSLSGRIDLLLAQVEQREKMKENRQQDNPQVTVEIPMSDEDAEIEEVSYDVEMTEATPADDP